MINASDECFHFNKIHWTPSRACPVLRMICEKRCSEGICEIDDFLKILVREEQRKGFWTCYWIVHGWSNTMTNNVSSWGAANTRIQCWPRDITISRVNYVTRTIADWLVCFYFPVSADAVLIVTFLFTFIFIYTGIFFWHRSFVNISVFFMHLT